MNTNYARNRRRTQRLATAGHLWWQHGATDRFEHGWIADRSTGGLAFVTDVNRSPRVGDSIDVSACHDARPDRAAGMSTYVIRRIESFDERLNLIACAMERSGRPPATA